MLFHVFNALLCPPLCIKRCPAFVNTFNHSHEFVQLSLALHLATFTNTDPCRWIKIEIQIRPQPHTCSYLLDICVTAANDTLLIINFFRGQCYDFQNVFANTFGGKMAFFVQNAASFYKNLT
jgi:hypothetical protein